MGHMTSRGLIYSLRTADATLCAQTDGRGEQRTMVQLLRAFRPTPNRCGLHTVTKS